MFQIYFKVLILTGLFSPILTTCPYAQQLSWSQRVAGKGELNVYFHPKADLIQTLPNGSPSGFLFDILEQFAASTSNTSSSKLYLDWIAEPHFLVMLNNLRSVKEGAIGTGDVSINPVRTAYLDYSPQVLPSYQVLITSDKHPKWTQFEQAEPVIQEMILVVNFGTSNELTCKEFLLTSGLKDVKKIPVNSYLEIVTRVSSDTTTYGFIDVFMYSALRKRGFNIIAQGFGEVRKPSIVVALPKNSSWTPKLRSFLDPKNGFINNPLFGELVKKHFVPEVAELLLR